MQTKTYLIDGMTCEHCVRAIREQLEGLAGVTSAEVSLLAGSVAVSGDNFTDEQIREAVVEAGYAVRS